MSTEEYCQVGSSDDEEVRWVAVTCGYSVEEVAPNATQEKLPDQRVLYGVRCCRNCRADFLQSFGKWIRGDVIDPRHDRDNGPYPYRKNGGIIYLSGDELMHEREQHRAKEPT